MKILNKISDFLEKYLGPVANKMGSNRMLQSIGRGAMGTMPVTLGVMVLSILSKFPYAPWLEFLTNCGLAAQLTELLNVTTNMLAIYFSVLIAYHYATLSGEKGINAGVISMASFLIVMPHTVSNKDGVVIAGLKMGYLGAEGLFVAMILALLTSWIYVKMMHKNIKIKLPESVPPMVSDSISPAIVSTVILGIAFLLRVMFSYTSWGDVFTCVSQVIAAPVMKVGANPYAVAVVYTFANICWFFGIHPTAITSAFLPVMLATGQGNVAAYLAGETMPYVATKIAIDCMLIGGAGNMLGLAISLFFAKSSRYKAMSKLAIAPAIFNINEPLVFGMPIILNPNFFIPMLINPSINVGLVCLLTKIGLASSYNPTVSSTAYMPKVFNGLFMGGFKLLLLYTIIIFVDFLIWFLFMKVADNQACKEEAKEVAAE